MKVSSKDFTFGKKRKSSNIHHRRPKNYIYDELKIYISASKSTQRSYILEKEKRNIWLYFGERNCMSSSNQKNHVHLNRNDRLKSLPTISGRGLVDLVGQSLVL